MDFKNFGKFTYTPTTATKPEPIVANKRPDLLPGRASNPGSSDAPPTLPEQALKLTRITRTLIPSNHKLAKEALAAFVVKAIFSSNFIERVGLDLAHTTELCRRIFSGDNIPTDDIPTREVVQHVKAFEYICEAVVSHDEPLSEEIIKETHRILTLGIDNLHGNGSVTPYEQYGGVYRTVPVSAGNTWFAVSRFVPKLMAEMVRGYQKDAGALRPCALAAKYSDAFVQIHPFEDGNGRVSRLIMNAVLIKYGGIPMALACEDEERDRYIGIMRRSSEQATEGEELAELVLEKSVEALREYEMTLSGR